MDEIYIIEEYFDTEGHDDFGCDYTGEVSRTRGEFFTSFDEAWEYLKNEATRMLRKVYEYIHETETYWESGEVAHCRIKELKRHK